MWATEIPRERIYGITRCCCVSSRGLSLHAALAAFGLDQRDDYLTEVTPEQAVAILQQILSVSFVGRSDAMAVDRAHALAVEFVDSFKHDGSKFFTNGDWASGNAYAWRSLTDSIFDGGLIVHGPSVSACVWVEEDD